MPLRADRYLTIIQNRPAAVPSGDVLCGPGRFLAPPHFSFKIKKENVGARRAPSAYGHLNKIFLLIYQLYYLRIV
jgi:hypothetical protein